MSDFLASVRQRKLVQWVLAYSAGAWVALEVVRTMSDTWLWSPVVGQVAFVALATGFGVACVAAWYHGERGAQRISTVEGALLSLIIATGIGAAVVVGRSGDRPSSAAAGGTATFEGTTAARPEASARSVLVLPFRDTSPDGGHAYLGDGIAETLINGLGRLEELRVVARTSAFAFRESGLDVREIAARLNAGTVLEGSVQQIGERIRITASLIDARDGLDLWSQKFDREAAVEDLFDLQDSVAQDILDALSVELGTSRRIVGSGTASAEAQRAFFLGQHHWTARTTSDMILAARYFQEAIEADSLWADPWSGLALAWVLHSPSEYNVPGFSLERSTALAIEAANRATTLDPEQYAAYTALGDAMFLTREYERSEAYFRRAIDINPGFATAHHWLADLLMVALRPEDALVQIDIAESLDPVAPAILVERAEALMGLGRVEEAFEQLDKAAMLLPEALLVLAYDVYFSMAVGDWPRAATSLERAALLAGESPGLAARLSRDLRDPSDRRAFLVRLRDGDLRYFNAGPALAGQLLGRPQVRFLASLHVDGLDPALDQLEGILSGPDWESVYGPLLPALLGPDVIATPRGQEIMRLYRSRS